MKKNLNSELIKMDYFFPSGPGLATIKSEFNYLESLRNSD